MRSKVCIPEQHASDHRVAICWQVLRFDSAVTDGMQQRLARRNTVRLPEYFPRLAYPQINDAGKEAATDNLVIRIMRLEREGFAGAQRLESA
jgi:hypothetical protein